MAGPLVGVRVVDLTTVLFGPYCTQIMAEMGADVIKVEPPGGDIGRQVGPARHPGMAAGHLVRARGKRSLVLDLTKSPAHDVLGRLTATADVFIHNMRPQAADKLGIAYERIVPHKADIVYCAAVGYGRDGPYARKPAYDDLIQGVSGFAHLMEGLTGEPRYAPSVIADKVSGLTALYTIMMALFHRARTGEGQAVDVAMFESFTSFVLIEHMQGHIFDPPMGPPGYSRLLTPDRRPYPTADGYVCVLPYSDRHWQRFFEIVGRPDLAADPRFRTVANRTNHIAELYRNVGEEMAKRTTAEWLGAFDRADVAAMPMNRLEDLFTDPHLQATGFFETMDHPSEGAIRYPRAGPVFSKTKPDQASPAPLLGEHSVPLLRELGFGAADIRGLVQSGVTHDGRDDAPAAAALS
ncbi:MAG: CoA transferase [Alphaproteobacteria bacterium]|nr:CoA transferase [Alphaproteobacteria bacterium]